MYSYLKIAILRMEYESVCIPATFALKTMRADHFGWLPFTVRVQLPDLATFNGFDFQVNNVELYLG